MKIIFLMIILGLGAIILRSYATASNGENVDTAINLNENADANSGVQTDMHGNTSTSTGGVPISSTSASSESGTK